MRMPRLLPPEWQFVVNALAKAVLTTNRRDAGGESQYAARV